MLLPSVPASAETILSHKEVEKGLPPPLSSANSEPAAGAGHQEEVESASSSPINPQDWESRRKWAATIIISCFSFNTMMTSTMIVPALSKISHDLNIKNEAQTQLTLSSYVISYAFGPFLWAPLSELYGRVIVLQIASAWFLVWNLACGFARSEGLLIAARLLSGMGASAALAISSGILSDCWRIDQRGRSFAVYTLIPLLGPAIGPILGGVITHKSTWRWAFWATSIFDAFLQLVACEFLPETHLSTLIRRKKRGTSGWSGFRQTLTAVESVLVATTLSKALRRPFHLTITQPVLQLLSVWAGVSFGMLYIVITTLPMMFMSLYGQGHIIASLNFVSLGIGFLIGAQAFGIWTDWLYQRHKSHMPEFRAALLLPSVIITGLGLVCTGWSAQARTHWIVPNIGMGFFGAGIQFSTQCYNAYVIDVYGPIGWSASAMASIWAVKSLTGFAFPLFGPSVYDTLGWGWCNSVLATGLVAAGVPVAVALQWHGDIYRKMGEKRLDS